MLRKTSLLLVKAVMMPSLSQKISEMKITDVKMKRMKARTQSKKNVHTLRRETNQIKTKKRRKTRILYSTTEMQKWSTLSNVPARFSSSSLSLKITNTSTARILLTKWPTRACLCLWNFAIRILKTCLSVPPRTTVLQATIQCQAIWSPRFLLREVTVPTVSSCRACSAQSETWKMTQHCCQFYRNRIPSRLKPKRL